MPRIKKAQESSSTSNSRNALLIVLLLLVNTCSARPVLQSGSPIQISLSKRSLLGVSKTIGYSESFKGTEEAGLTVAKNAKKVTPKSASKLHANGPQVSNKNFEKNAKELSASTAAPTGKEPPKTGTGIDAFNQKGKPGEKLKAEQLRQENLNAGEVLKAKQQFSKGKTPKSATGGEQQLKSEKPKPANKNSEKGAKNPKKTNPTPVSNNLRNRPESASEERVRKLIQESVDNPNRVQSGVLTEKNPNNLGG
ncbi:hypothetical protein PCANC_21468 [Puccinia coronata f. sp. avenae]|uniref:Uncharacterized protein n=1 Tax=Puccinia coronata f. sp. avenae TaxID=200324 RepID=A0A2N5U029_9BASI|nr:hypothetical protein PCANC_21468 [Puccinia coronata f. sp. avenae]